MVNQTRVVSEPRAAATRSPPGGAPGGLRSEWAAGTQGPGPASLAGQEMGAQDPGSREPGRGAFLLRAENRRWRMVPGGLCFWNLADTGSVGTRVWKAPAGRYLQYFVGHRPLSWPLSSARDHPGQQGSTPVWRDDSMCRRGPLGAQGLWAQRSGGRGAGAPEHCPHTSGVFPLRTYPAGRSAPAAPQGKCTLSGLGNFQNPGTVTAVLWQNIVRAAAMN